ncbi:MAG: hypothetical protein ACPGVO_00085 [Spirulinaceae cyanobacterium]
MTQTYDVQRDRRVDLAFGGATIISCRIAQGIIVMANVRPYSRLVTDVLAKVFGFQLWGPLSAATGFVLLLGIQAAELRPLMIHRPNPEKLKRVEQVATLGFLVDAVLALYNWPVIEVSLARFVAAPTLSSVNWINCLMAIAIVFGVAKLESIVQTVQRDI